MYRLSSSPTNTTSPLLRDTIKRTPVLRGCCWVDAFIGRSGWLTSRVRIWSFLVQGAFPHTFCFLKVRRGQLHVHLCRTLKFPRNKTNLPYKDQWFGSKYLVRVSDTVFGYWSDGVQQLAGGCECRCVVIFCFFVLQVSTLMPTQYSGWWVSLCCMTYSCCWRV